LYRLVGWLPGVCFLSLVPFAANGWLAVAAGLFGASQFGHWVTERAEVARGRQLMPARVAEVVAALAAGLIGLVGLIAWGIG
jgi:hypothetical protein